MKALKRLMTSSLWNKVFCSSVNTLIIIKVRIILGVMLHSKYPLTNNSDTQFRNFLHYQGIRLSHAFKLTYITQRAFIARQTGAAESY